VNDTAVFVDDHLLGPGNIGKRSNDFDIQTLLLQNERRDNRLGPGKWFDFGPQNFAGHGGS
jgi:hypothetical protein